jgi:hypothetical protein
MAGSTAYLAKGNFNIYLWLDEVRERPDMYIQSLRDLESEIWGYNFALRNHCIVEPVPKMCLHFLHWLYCRTGWSMDCGFALAIEREISDYKEQLNTFFSLVDEYRKLKPTILCTVRLGKQHQPTGKRVVIGYDGRMEKPKRVDIVRYVPEPLYFLRFHNRDEIIDGDLLINPDGTYKSTINKVKKWAYDELQIKRDEWQEVS